MADLHWTVPIARWTSISTTGVPGVEALDPMVRRRLSRLSRFALQAAYDCAGAEKSLRMVFASRHGELARTAAILDDIQTAEPVSPTAFSLSVLNAVTGIFGIARCDRSPATAISAGPETLGYALLEAASLYETSPESPVLLVYAHEPVDPVFGRLCDDDPESVGLAILLNADASDGYLVCDVASVDRNATQNVVGEAVETQSAAVLHCLSAHTPTTWCSGDALWRWKWYSHAA